MILVVVVIWVIGIIVVLIVGLWGLLIGCGGCIDVGLDLWVSGYL